MPIQKITKEEIVRRATDVFRRKGYYDTSMADLSVACGIRNAHFYYYFKNKEDLMAEVLRSVQQFTAERLQRYAHDESQPPRERLARITRFFERLYAHATDAPDGSTPEGFPPSVSTGAVSGAGSGAVSGAGSGGCIMANTTLETALVPSGFTPVLKTFFETWVNALKHLYLTKYSEAEALELAEATVQDIEGGLMLMKLYRDKKYLLNALKRSENRLNE